MSEEFALTLIHRNPDVLTCIANLSNDEVFTPPDFANEMLDLLTESWSEANGGANIWADKTVKFLDPCTKSGVFLREIVLRLVEGLENEIPNLQERIDYILKNQVFGLAITELTSLLARRSVYCSKWADGPHSVAKSFDNPDGNIWFARTEHSWAGGSPVETADANGRPLTKYVGGRCKFCGATQTVLDRGESLETHAYALIHSYDVNESIADWFGEDMQFDVIIGNPPYQLADNGVGGAARPIYQQFIKQAIALEPRFLVMVVPSRWFSGGRGLDEFRKEMLGDKRLRHVVDFIVDKDAFPKVNVNGGLNYFLWDRDNQGDCTIVTVKPGGERGVPSTRPLDEFDIFIRRNEAVPILRKVRAKGESTFDKRVSSLKPFGLRTFFHGAPSMSKSKQVKLYGSGKVSWISKSDVLANVDWVDRWKVLIPRATDGNENYPLPIWDQVGPFIAGPGEACSETYLVASLVKDRKEASYLVDYMRTKFFRFMVWLRKATQDNKVDNFSFVPDLPLDRTWSDQLLYDRYGLDADEISFIESMIRDMEFSGE